MTISCGKVESIMLHSLLLLNFLSYCQKVGVDVFIYITKNGSP